MNGSLRNGSHSKSRTCLPRQYSISPTFEAQHTTERLQAILFTSDAGGWK